MTTTTRSTPTILKFATTPIRYLLLGCLLLAALSGVLAYETEYTKVSHVEATVVAKTDNSAKGGRTADYDLAVRTPDGAMQSIHANAAVYAGTAVGDTIQVATSPQLRREPSPGAESARTLLLIALTLGTAASLATALTTLVCGYAKKQ